MPDITEKLERLAGLLEKGLLTREEFDEQKAALLAQSRPGSAPKGDTVVSSHRPSPLTLSTAPAPASPPPG